MNNEHREIYRKIRILKHAEKIGNVSKTCQYFGIGRGWSAAQAPMTV